MLDVLVKLLCLMAGIGSQTAMAHFLRIETVAIVVPLLPDLVRLCQGLVVLVGT